MFNINDNSSYFPFSTYNSTTTRGERMEQSQDHGGSTRELHSDRWWTMQCAVMAVVCNITVGNSVTMACNSAVGNTTVEPSERASRSTVAAAAQENWGLLSSHQTPAASTLLTVTIGPVALRQWHRHQVQHQVQHQVPHQEASTLLTQIPSISTHLAVTIGWMLVGF